MLGWEAGLWVYGADLDILEVEMFPASATDAAADPWVFQVDLGQPVSVLQPIKLARFTATRLASGLFDIVLRAADVSTFPQYVQGRPGWTDDAGGAECPGPCLRPFQGITVGGYLSSDFGTGFCTAEACFSFIERPLSGDVWVGGSEETVLYSTAPSTRPLLEYTLDGNTWEILTSIPYTSTGSGTWPLPNVETDLAQIRICGDCCLKLDSIYEYSGVFSITKRVATETRTWSAVKARYD